MKKIILSILLALSVSAMAYDPGDHWLYVDHDGYFNLTDARTGEVHRYYYSEIRVCHNTREVQYLIGGEWIEFNTR